MRASWAPPQPVTRVQEPAECEVHAQLTPTPQGRVHLTLSKRVTEGAVHTSQEDIATSVSAYWEGLLNAVHAPSEQAERDKAGVLNRLRAETKSLPKSVRASLRTGSWRARPRRGRSVAKYPPPLPIWAATPPDRHRSPMSPHMSPLCLPYTSHTSPLYLGSCYSLAHLLSDTALSLLRADSRSRGALPVMFSPACARLFWSGRARISDPI